MTGSLLGISITGLRAAQSSLSTTGHNIANADVEGFSRQRTELSTNPATLQNAGYVGNGVTVSAIERIADQFVTEQLRIDTSLFTDLESYFGNISQLDSLLSDASTGLSSALESFFASVQNGADDPTSIPARQLILSESENLSDRFNTLYSRFEIIDEGVDTSIRTTTAQINALTTNIAELNQKVSEAIGRSNGQSPNDLLDQRDEALRKLAELVSIQTFDQGFGQVNVVIAGGQNLVVGNEFRELNLVTSDQNPQKLEVVFIDGASETTITDAVNGGELGGLIRFQNGILEQAYNELGRIAVVMADTFNEIHQQGITLNDQFGGNFFYDVNNTTVARNRVIANSENTPPQDRVISLNIADSSEITTSDYMLTIEAGGLFRVERLSDSTEVSSGLLTGAYPLSVEFDGLEMVFEDGSFQEGDAYRLQPTRLGARDFSSSLVNPSDIAFGSPLVTEASLGNTGTGAISSGDVLSLSDQDGNPLAIFSNPGELNPPLGIVFRTATTYDVVNISDPSNPVQLEPPIRNQRYVVGAQESIFPADPGGTLVTTSGGLIGLPTGTDPILTAALVLEAPTASPPDFTVTDFSPTTSQFAFDIVVSGTAGGVNDGTFTINIANSSIPDESSLVSIINAQLTGSDVAAYLSDTGTLAFRLITPGSGDITLQNYDDDPDGNLDLAVAGQANNLLGFNIEGATFTTVGDVDGVSGDGEVNNRYPAEVISLTRPSDIPGQLDVTENLFTNLHASARETAGMLNNEPGVYANAFNYLEISNLQVSRDYPLQITLNGEDLIQTQTDTSGVVSLASGVPNPQTEPNEFNDYLAEQINNNANLAALGIYAVAGGDAVTSLPELQIHSSEGDDLQIDFIAQSGQTIDVSDGVNENLSLLGNGNSVASSILVGGNIDISLDDGVSMTTFPSNSLLFGDSSTANFARSTYIGIQATLEGVPNQGDQFNIQFNSEGASDNRNALALSELQIAGTMDEGQSNFTDSYSSLVEVIGIGTSATRINRDASEQVLEQTTATRDSISAVNLDEEASNLLRFEQIYSANAQVISVARDLFDRLINSF